MFDVGSIGAKIKLDTGNWDKGMRKVGADLSKVAGTMRRTFTGLASFAVKSMAITGTAIGGGVVALDLLGANVRESEDLFRIAFGKMADTTRQWSNDFAHNLNMDAYEVRKFASTLNTVFKGMGFGGEQAAFMSKKLTQLSYDLASFHNLNTEEAFGKVVAGMTGEAEPLKRLGYLLLDNNIEAFAKQSGMLGGRKYSDMSQMEKTMARFGLLLEQTKLAQGNMEQTKDFGGNLLKGIVKPIAELTKTIAAELAPAFEVIHRGLKNMSVAARDFVIKNLPGISKFTDGLKDGLTPFMKDMENAFKNDFLPWVQELPKQIEAMWLKVQEHWPKWKAEIMEILEQLRVLVVELGKLAAGAGKWVLENPEKTVTGLKWSAIASFAEPILSPLLSIGGGMMGAKMLGGGGGGAAGGGLLSRMMGGVGSAGKGLWGLGKGLFAKAAPSAGAWWLGANSMSPVPKSAGGGWASWGSDFLSSKVPAKGMGLGMSLLRGFGLQRIAYDIGRTLNAAIDTATEFTLADASESRARGTKARQGNRLMRGVLGDLYELEKYNSDLAKDLREKYSAALKAAAGDAAAPAALKLAEEIERQTRKMRNNLKATRDALTPDGVGDHSGPRFGSEAMIQEQHAVDAKRKRAGAKDAMRAAVAAMWDSFGGNYGSWNTEAGQRLQEQMAEVRRAYYGGADSKQITTMFERWQDTGKVQEDAARQQREAARENQAAAEELRAASLDLGKAIRSLPKLVETLAPAAQHKQNLVEAY